MSTARKPASRNPAAAAAENKSNGTPVTFDLDAYEAEARHDPFTFTLKGQTFTMPHISDLDRHGAVDVNGEAVWPGGHALIRAGLGAQWEAFDKLQLSGGAYGELQRRYLKHSGVELGEGDASPDSSASTAGQ